MSTAQSKTDEGPEDIISGSEDLSDEDNVHPKNRTRAKRHEDVTTLPEVQIDELEGQIARSNGNLSEGYKDAKQKDKAAFDSGAELLNSLEERRPSSANGSLSTPDNTPSLQVFHTFWNDSSTCLTAPEFHTVFSSKRPPLRPSR